MKKGPLILAAVLVLAAAGAFFGYRAWQAGRTPPPGALAGPQSGGVLPPFALKDVSGNLVRSDVLKGKPAVVNFFATWCPPCREEIPGFVAVHEKYRDQGFEMVGISLDTDTRGNLPGFVLSNRIGYRILLGDKAATAAYGGVSAIPTTVFVGKDGRIRSVHIGYMDRETFDAEVRKLL